MADLDYARVVGRWGITIGDTGDPDDEPETVFCTAGNVTITPLVTQSKVIAGTGGAYTLKHEPILATISSTGHLHFNGKDYVDVVDLTSSKVNPQVGTNQATHTISFDSVKAGAVDVELDSFACRLTAAGDGITAGGVNDLTAVAPVSASGATPIIRGPIGLPGIAQGAIVGGHLVFTMIDGSTIDTGPLPAGTDSSVAGWIADVATLTSAAFQTAVEDRDYAPGGDWAFTGAVTVDGVAVLTSVSKAAVGLGNVDNTSDANKPLSSAATTALAAKADLVSGKVPNSQLPTFSQGGTFPVANQAAMLALTGVTVGDFAVRADLSNQPFRLAALPASTLANWVAFGTTPSVTSVAGHTGVVVLVKGDVGLGNVDNTSDANKPVSTAAATALALKASTAQLAALRSRDLADFTVTVPNDDNIPVFDTTAGKYSPTDGTTMFAGVDPTTGQTLPEAAPAFNLFGFIIPEGDPPPAGLPLGLNVPIIGFTRAAAPSLVPVLLDDNFAQSAVSVVLTMPEDLNVGDRIGLAIGGGNEVANVDHYTIAFSTGAATTAFGTLSVPNLTATAQLVQATITTKVPAGATITITAKDASNANYNRAALMAAAYRLPNILSTAALDVQAVAGGNSSSTMTAITVGPTAANTAQNNEVAIGAAAWNSSATATRTLDGTNGWQLISEQKAVAASGRSLAVFYKVLTAVGKPSLTTLMTASDSATGQWAGALAAYEATT